MTQRFKTIWRGAGSRPGVPLPRPGLPGARAASTDTVFDGWAQLDHSNVRLYRANNFKFRHRSSFLCPGPRRETEGGGAVGEGTPGVVHIRYARLMLPQGCIGDYRPTCRGIRRARTPRSFEINHGVPTPAYPPGVDAGRRRTDGLGCGLLASSDRTRNGKYGVKSNRYLVAGSPTFDKGKLRVATPVRSSPV